MGRKVTTAASSAAATSTTDMCVASSNACWRFPQPFCDSTSSAQRSDEATRQACAYSHNLRRRVRSNSMRCSEADWDGWNRTDQFALSSALLNWTRPTARRER